MVTKSVKNGFISGKENPLKNEKIIAIFCRLRGIGFFGQDELNWIFLSSKIASYAFFERKKLLSKVP